MKKVFLTCLFVVVIISVTALPSFAADVNFVLSKYPSDFLVNDDSHQSFDFVFRNSEGNYRYGVLVFTGNANFFSESSFSVSLFSFNNVTSVINDDVSTPYLLPCFHYVNSSYQPYFPATFQYYVYDTQGTLLTDSSSYSPFSSGYIFRSTQNAISPLFMNFANSYNNALFSSLFDPFSFYVLHSNSVPFDFESVPSSYVPSSYVFLSDSGYYDFVNDDATSCSLEDDIYINGALVYSASSPNLAIKVISNGIGSLVPEYDGNGNITGYTFNVTTESDYSQIFEYRPDYDVPGLEFDYSSDMPNVEFTQNQLSELSVMDGGSALTWFYARINDLGAGNVKILALMTSCLSLGFVTLILNKRV